MRKTIWISHSAISSYSKCPHLYYLEYVYRNPETGNRIQTVNPYLSLGLAVHETVENLADLPAKERSNISLEERFAEVFKRYKGIKGGFISKNKEERFKERGLSMVRRVESSSLLKKPSVTIDKNIPFIDITEDRSMKLVGYLDWIELLPGGGVHIIDFKTGNSKESGDSLQLPIYTILAKNNLSHRVEKVSYWYLQQDEHPVAREMDDLSLFWERIKGRAFEIRSALREGSFPCNYPGRCFMCSEYEKIFRGEAELVGREEKRGKDVFYVFKKEDIMEKVMEEEFLDEREKKIFEMRMKHNMEEINRELRLSQEKSEKIVRSIKEKMKDNLSSKELKVLIRALNGQNGISKSH